MEFLFTRVNIFNLNFALVVFLSASMDTDFLRGYTIKTRSLRRVRAVNRPGATNTSAFFSTKC